jgi:pimeloyl-ACP methyl ester carboxylesterase
MLEDYFRTDLWDVLEDSTRPTERHVIAGGDSDVLDASDRERAQRCPKTTLDVIPNAGHWVHVDAPDALRTIVTRYL